MHLKELEKIWNKKLKDSGFIDIEDTNSPLRLLKKWHSNYFYRNYSPEVFEARYDYFRITSQFLHYHSFESQLERQVFELHTEGLSYREIGAKMGINKDKVNKIVGKLIEIMKNHVWVESD